MRILGLLAEGAVVAVAGCGNSSSTDDVSQYSAQDMCHTFVGKRLKSPATADYGDDSTTGSGLGPWVVSGHVDSENGFGAKLRSRYVCTMTADATVDSDGNRTWHLTDMQFVDGGEVGN